MIWPNPIVELVPHLESFEDSAKPELVYFPLADPGLHHFWYSKYPTYSKNRLSHKGLVEELMSFFGLEERASNRRNLFSI